MNSREEQIIRAYIRESLSRDRAPLHEGMIKDALVKAFEFAATQIEALMNKFREFSLIKDKVMEVLSEKGAESVISAVESEGEEFAGALKIAGSELPNLKEGTRAHRLYREYRGRQLVLESNWRRVRSRALNESLIMAAFTGTGFLLATIGAIPILLNGFAKALGLLSKVMPSVKKAQAAVKHAAEVSHHFEGKFIDIVIPDAASYAVYLKIQELVDSKNYVDKMSNTKIYEEDPSASIVGDRYPTLDEYKTSQDRKKYESGMYALLLLPWIIQGLTQLHHALHSLHGAGEALATAEKTLFASRAGAEIGKDVVAAATAIEKGAEMLVKAV